jgi:hypothetical protein
MHLFKEISGLYWHSFLQPVRWRVPGLHLLGRMEREVFVLLLQMDICFRNVAYATKSGETVKVGRAYMNWRGVKCLLCKILLFFLLAECAVRSYLVTYELLHMQNVVGSVEYMYLYM